MNRRRRGFSLIELTSVLTVLSLVWLAITTTLYTLYRADHRIRDHLQQQQAIERFAAKLVLDAHSAKTADEPSTDGDRNQVTLEYFGKPDVRYHFESGKIYRSVIVNGETTGQDSFGIDAERVAFSVSKFDRSWLVTAEIESHDERANAARVQTVKAAVTVMSVVASPKAEAAP